jgi:UDP-N-acetylglucosamine 2-epimerase (non-hydrolysing)
MAPSPSVRPISAKSAGSALSVLPLAPVRSAVIRLSPVVEALASSGRSGKIVDTMVLDALVECRGPCDLTNAVEQAVKRVRPTVALLAGDSDAVVTCALVATRLGVPIALIGAGLRCGDRGIGEEVNRIVLDGLAGRCYADGDDAVQNLLDEGVAPDRIVCVGSTLPDVVLPSRDAAIARRAWCELGVPAGEYVLVALRRDENLDDEERLTRIATALSALAMRMPLVVSLAPEVRLRLELTGELARLRGAGAVVIGPLPYAEFLSLEAGAGAVVTDSSGIQEETSVLGVPCFTLRYTTERQTTLIHGTNTLLGDDPEELAAVITGPRARGAGLIPRWDGEAGRRIAADLRSGGIT